MKIIHHFRIIAFIALILVATWTSFFPGSTLKAAPQLVLNAEQQRFKLGLFADILEDPTGKLTIDEVRSAVISSQFTPSTTESPNLGISESALWLRIVVHNPENNPRFLLLENHSYFTTFEVYRFTKDGALNHDKKEISKLIEEKQSRWNMLVTENQFSPLETQTLYIRVTGKLELHLNLSLWEADPLRDFYITESLLLGAAWGFTALAILVNFVVYLFTRQNGYLYFCLFFLSFLIFRMQFTLWETIYIFPFPDWNDYLTLISIQSLLIFGIRYYQKQFYTSKSSPRLHRIANRWQIFYLLILLLPILASIQMITKLVIVSLFFMVYFMWVGIPIYWRSGLLSVRLNVVAYCTLAFFGFVHGLRSMGFIPDTIITIHILEIALVVKILILTAAWIARTKEISTEKQIAQKQALSNLRRADEIKDRLLANTSHELRTPLHGMIGLTENIINTSAGHLGTQTIRHLNLVADNAHRLNRLVSNLMDSAKLKDEEIKLHLESVVLHPIAEAVINLVQPFGEDNKLRCVNEIPPDFPAVSADPNRLQQVLLNLANNAVKYTDSGTVKISAYLADHTVSLEVADTGIGIPEDQIDLIFESFHRGHNPGVPKQEGLGLGLSICSELLAAHGSQLKVRSTLEQGSVFFFNLPVSIQTDDAGSTERVLEKPAPSYKFQKHQSPTKPLLDNQGANIDKSAKPPHILVVDDDLTNLEIVFGYLMGKYRVTSCSSGQEALDTLENDSSFSLVLLDVMMPQLDGFEVCELIREKYSARELPVLLLTALTEEEDITQAYRSGANDYLGKPFRKAELNARISAQLQLSGFNRGTTTQTAPGQSLNRQILVETLQMSLKVWEKQTGNSHLDLALESNIWGTYLEKNTGTLRARILQNYLSTKTLPGKPRWRKVVQTAEFVLDRCSEHSELKLKLNNQLDLLNRTLKEFPF